MMTEKKAREHAIPENADVWERKFAEGFLDCWNQFKPVIEVLEKLENENGDIESVKLALERIKSIEGDKK